jgi:hypothetical protein
VVDPASSEARQQRTRVALVVFGLAYAVFTMVCRASTFVLPMLAGVGSLLSCDAMVAVQLARRSPPKTPRRIRPQGVSLG